MKYTLNGKRRVVVTGGGLVSSLGNDTTTAFNRLKTLKNTTQYMTDWDYYEKLFTKIACPCSINFEESRRNRGMGRVALLALAASDEALTSANLLDSQLKVNQDLANQIGVAYGSSMSSMEAIYDLARMHRYHKTRTIDSTTYFKGMPHTCAANLELAYKTRGRLFNTSEACTSGSSAIGISFEQVQEGKQLIMIAGGADELTPQMAMVFDYLNVTSLKNKHPELTPSPFDSQSDGLVVGEGAGTLILEDLESAISRKATIYAEVVGFGTNTDGDNPTKPSSGGMSNCMLYALESAKLKPVDIDYINMHGTGTATGDTSEIAATFGVFGKRTLVSSTKSYIGHTLGACGAIEAWLTIQMMNNNWFHPTLNLNTPKSDNLNFIKGTGVELDIEYAMSNNFAFAGINTSLIFKKWHNV